MKLFIRSLFLLALVASLAACAPQANQPGDSRLKIVATTTIVGDVIHNIAGEAVDLTVLLPPGTDPHTFQPTPQDAAKLADAQLIFINGAGLETFLDKLLESSGSQGKVVDLSQGITLLAGHEHDAGATPEAGHPQGDPHVWTDPNNVIVWVQNAVQALSQADSSHTATYQANAEAYQKALVDLDQWIRQQVELVPVEKRKLVMDHEIFGYFANRYGFEEVGAVIPGFSTLAEPSAQELAALEDAIHGLGINALFVSFEVSPTLAQRVAGDTGIQLVYVYSGSLSKAGGDADTYLKFIHYNTSAIVNALK
jgi:manganese/iron transport system substrate-binding protein